MSSEQPNHTQSAILKHLNSLVTASNSLVPPIANTINVLLSEIASLQNQNVAIIQRHQYLEGRVSSLSTELSHLQNAFRAAQTVPRPTSPPPPPPLPPKTEQHIATPPQHIAGPDDATQPPPFFDHQPPRRTPPRSPVPLSPALLSPPPLAPTPPSAGTISHPHSYANGRPPPTPPQNMSRSGSRLKRQRRSSKNRQSKVTKPILYSDDEFENSTPDRSSDISTKLSRPALVEISSENSNKQKPSARKKRYPKKASSPIPPKRPVSKLQTPVPHRRPHPITSASHATPVQNPSAPVITGFKSPAHVAQAVDQLVQQQQSHQQPKYSHVERIPATTPFNGKTCMACHDIFTAAVASHPNAAERYAHFARTACPHQAELNRPQTPERFRSMTFDETETQPPPGLL